MNVVKNSYRIVHNMDVKNGSVILRECMAKRAAQFAKDKNIHPKDLTDRLRKELMSVRVSGNIFIEKDNFYQFSFEDYTKLTWLQDFGEYAISYSETMTKVIFIPKEIPIYKHRINYLEHSEAELIEEVLEAMQKNHNAYDDLNESEMIGMGCG